MIDKNSFEKLKNLLDRLTKKFLKSNDNSRALEAHSSIYDDHFRKFMEYMDCESTDTVSITVEEFQEYQTLKEEQRKREELSDAMVELINSPPKGPNQHLKDLMASEPFDDTHSDGDEKWIPFPSSDTDINLTQEEALKKVDEFLKPYLKDKE